MNFSACAAMCACASVCACVRRYRVPGSKYVRTALCGLTVDTMECVQFRLIEISFVLARSLFIACCFCGLFVGASLLVGNISSEIQLTVVERERKNYRSKRNKGSDVGGLLNILLQRSILSVGCVERLVFKNSSEVQLM